MPRHILYIINPISGGKTKKDLRAFIEAKTSKAGIPFSVFPSVASGDYSFLRPLIKEQQVTDIIIAGGDGTVSSVIHSLRDLDLHFGIIPCGSGNGLAYAANIPRSPGKALDLAFKGKTISADAFLLNDRFACMLCGLGFDAKVAHDFAEQPGRGLANYVKMVIRNFFSARTYTFDITVRGTSFSTEAFFISIANSNQFGNNFTIAPRASLQDGLLDIVIVTKQSKLALLLKVLGQVRGKNRLQTDSLIDKNKAVIYFQTDALQICNPGEALLHIDGDPAETAKEIKVKLLKGCFKLITP